jgi:RHS repeat-associated protein
MKFTGEYLDPTALYHLRARQYDPTSGRFLSPDPVAASSEDPYASTYTYVSNRPTMLLDPSGLRWCRPLCGVTDAVETAVGEVGEFVEEHNADIYLGLAGVVCVLGAVETGGLSCSVLGYSALAAGLSRAAVQSGIIGGRPTNYCLFAFSAGTSLGLFGAVSTVNHGLFKPLYVQSGMDRRILKASTKFVSGGINFLGGAGFATLCGAGSVKP